LPPIELGANALFHGLSSAGIDPGAFHRGLACASHDTGAPLADALSHGLAGTSNDTSAFARPD
jgi:hypothetical protein